MIRRIALGLPVNENGGVVGGLGMCGEGGVSAEGLTGEGYVVSVGSGEGEPGGVVRVPLMVDRTNGIASVEVRVTYNAYLLTLESVTNGPVSGAYGFAYHGGTGYVDIVMSAAEGITASNGIVAYLDFRVKGSAGVGTMSELTITRNDLGDAYGGEFEWRTGVGASNGWVWVVMGTGDSDGDGLTDYEEQHYDGSALYDPGGADTDALNPDTDGDGMKDGDEVRAGTDPLKAESMLEIESLRAISGNGLVIQWQSVAGKRYTINWTTNLLNGFEALKTNIIGIAPDNVYTDTYNGTGPCYYRIKLEK